MINEQFKLVINLWQSRSSARPGGASISTVSRFPEQLSFPAADKKHEAINAPTAHHVSNSNNSNA